MRKSLIVVENFYRDPFSVREYALRQHYYYPYQPDSDVASGRVRPSWMTSWFKSANECPFKSSAPLIDSLEQATGEKIDRDHWNLDFPINSEGKAAQDCRTRSRSCLWNCSFHLKPETKQELGEGVHNHVVDGWNSVGEHGWAGLIYFSLRAPLSGGLKLWRNRDRTKDLDWMTPKENWELVDDIGNVFNRLILCRGNIPHSGAAGWGSDSKDGRLYQTFFFKVLRPRLAKGLELESREFSADLERVY